MVSLGVAPLAVRSEFTEDRTWGPLARARRYELSTPSVTGPIHGISETVGCVHGARSSLIVRIGGGHLRAPSVDLLRQVAQEAPSYLDAASDRPAEHVRTLVSWLEHQQQAGFLERAYLTATVIVAVSDEEVWVWLVSPHGIVHGSPDAMSFESTDLRYPVLRGLGLMQQAPFKFLGADAGDSASSICCIGTPDGYEATRTRLRPGELVIALDRGSVPFGPWPEHPISLNSLWEMDAAWRHGLPGQAIAFGDIHAANLRLTDGWTAREVQLRG